MVAKLIEETFQSFFILHNFKKTDGRISLNEYYTNGMISFEFVFDVRNDEIGINAFRNDKKNYKNILACFEEFMPKNNIDVFQFLKLEYDQLDGSLSAQKHALSEDNYFFFC